MAKLSNDLSSEPVTVVYLWGIFRFIGQISVTNSTEHLDYPILPQSTKRWQSLHEDSDARVAGNDIRMSSC